jgi:leucyl-tRNA synthetase
LYARFWHKVLYDRGYVSTSEPFGKLVNQGMILGETEFTAYHRGGDWVSLEDVKFDDARVPYVDNAGKYPQLLQGYPSLALEPAKLTAEEVQKQGEGFVLKADPGIRVESRAYKMSKSRGNVVNPDQVVAEYGADALRLYEMFMGPLEAVKPWSMDGVSGVRNFLDRAWRMIIDDRAEEVRLHPAVQDVEPTAEQNRVLHKTIRAVTADAEQLAFNTAIARMMEFTNYFFKADVRPRAAMERFVLLLSPFAPHLAEELWQALGHARTLAYEPWPSFDPELVKEDTVEVPIQINGKLRAKILVSAASGNDRVALEGAARANPRVAELLSGKTVVKTIVVPGRMVNYVIK